MRWLIYNVLFAVGYLCLLPYYLVRMCRRGGYRENFMQRLGFYDAATREALRTPRIWVHAVSVGEMLVALKFIDVFRAALPGLRFVVSVNTSTGYALARRRLPAEDCLIYYPADFPWVVRRVLAQVNVRALVLTEGEFWPNLLRAFQAKGIPTGLINGRVSDSSFRGYRRVRPFFAPVLAGLSPACMQTTADAARMQELGVPSTALKITGNAKYDVPQMRAEDASAAREIFAAAGLPGDAVILLGGSTWPGEEKVLAGIYRTLQKETPALRLVLAPRHAERRQEVAAILTEAGLNPVFRSRCRAGETSGSTGPESVLLLDTTGELQSLYAGADLIFVGKSLTAQGGQNIIEPAQYGKPIVVGPHLENFRAVADDFLKAGALVQVPDAVGLEEALRALLREPDRAAALGASAGRWVSGCRGVLAETVDLLRKHWNLS
jgi:3-deoxy-D-manno-octulosonic-acid transferase